MEGQHHILFQMRLVRLQKKAVIDVVYPTIQRSAWYTFSKMIIQTLLCSDCSEGRKAGVQKIVYVMVGYDETMGDLSIRPRKTPSINPSATTQLELID